MTILRAYQKRMTVLFPELPKISMLWLMLSYLGNRCATSDPLIILSSDCINANRVRVLAQFSRSVAIGVNLVIQSVVCVTLFSYGSYNLFSRPSSAAFCISILYIGLVVLYRPTGLTPRYIVRKYITPMVGSFHEESQHLCGILNAFAQAVPAHGRIRRRTVVPACAIAKTVISGDFVVTSIPEAMVDVRLGQAIRPDIKDRAMRELRFMDDLLRYAILDYTAWGSLALTVLGYAIFPNISNYTRGVTAMCQSATAFLLIVPLLHATPSLRIFRDISVFFQNYRGLDCMTE